MYSVYVLSSMKDGKLYTGYTGDLAVRLAEHNAGRVASTKNIRPLKLVYTETYADQKDAIRRERYLKTGWGRRFLKDKLSDSVHSA